MLKLACFALLCWEAGGGGGAPSVLQRCAVGSSSGAACTTGGEAALQLLLARQCDAACEAAPDGAGWEAGGPATALWCSPLSFQRSERSASALEICVMCVGGAMRAASWPIC